MASVRYIADNVLDCECCGRVTKLIDSGLLHEVYGFRL